MYCLKCGAEVPDNGKFCLNCGSPIGDNQERPKMQYKCEVCSAIIDGDLNEKKECPYCGHVNTVGDESPLKEKKTKKKSKLLKFTMLFFIICLLAMWMSFVTDHIICGVVALIQAILFGTSWLMGKEIIPSKSKSLYKLLAFIGFVLIVVFFMTADKRMEEKPTDTKSTTVTTKPYTSSTSSNVPQATAKPTPKPTVKVEKTEDEIDEEVTEETVETDKDIEEVVEENLEEKVEEKAEDKAEEKPVSKDENVLDPDFKAYMDSYEAYMDEYIDFMEHYAESDNPLKMLSEYNDMMQKYMEFAEKIDEYDEKESEMSKADWDYYIDVTTRVQKKLLSAAY